MISEKIHCIIKMLLSCLEEDEVTNSVAILSFVFDVLVCDIRKSEDEKGNLFHIFCMVHMLCFVCKMVFSLVFLGAFVL